MDLVERKKNILIVDDNRRFVESLKNTLHLIYGAYIDEIFFAYSGEECLKITKNENVDIVFMDYQMPGLNGAETATLLTSTNRFIKIIAISLFKELEYMTKMLEAGACDYIPKDEIGDRLTSPVFKEYFKSN